MLSQEGATGDIQLYLGPDNVRLLKNRLSGMKLRLHIGWIWVPSGCQPSTDEYDPLEPGYVGVPISGNVGYQIRRRGLQRLQDVETLAVLV